jgi:phage terminase large subunit-like protein
LWTWFDALEKGVPVDPQVEPWPRGGAKSSTGELGTAYVGAKGTRKFCLYVSETQDQANKHVQAVATHLERIGLEREVGKYGNAKGWRVDLLRASNGFNVAALGLDSASRGVKLDEYRPDLIIFDDIDNENDGVKILLRKENTIKSAIIPTGSFDCAYLFLQNLIHEDSIVSKLVDGRADFLHNREVPTVEPAVIDLEVTLEDKGDGRKVYRVIGGTPTWAGQDLKTCEKQINEWGYFTFKRESQHEVKGADGFFFQTAHFEEAEELPEGKYHFCRAWDLAKTQGGGDYTVGVLMAIAENGRVYVVDVKRAQLAPNNVRNLIGQTAERDRAGEVWTQDEYDERGNVTKDAEFSHRFPLTGIPKLRIPQDPFKTGKEQAERLAHILREFRPSIVPVGGSKATRAMGWAEQVNAGNAILIKADWNRAFREEHRKFREDEQHENDDQVDASADAFNELWENRPHPKEEQPAVPGTLDFYRQLAAAQRGDDIYGETDEDDD